MTQANLARKFRKEAGPKMPTSELARKMHKEHPLMFKKVDNARDALRYIEGKCGGKKRQIPRVKNSEYFMEEKRTTNPYALPEPDSDDLEPYRLPKAFNNFILAGDFHIPNHRMPPINAMINYAKENKITKLFINGDLLDNTPFSKWVNEPVTPSDVPRWFDMAKDFLRTLKQTFTEIYWLEGNHDFWFKRFLMTKAELLFGDKYFHLEERLALNELGVKYIDQKYLVKAGHLNIVHGHILFRGGGSYANAARMLYQKTKANTIASHVHVESSHSEPDLNDKLITTFTTGCMCSLRPDYQPYGGKACHGFAHIQIKNNGDFNLKNFRIYKGEIM